MGTKEALNIVQMLLYQVSTMLSRGAREPLDNVSGLSIGLNKVILGWGKIRTCRISSAETGCQSALSPPP